MTPRAVAVGILLLPLSAWWQVQIEYVRASDNATITALFFHVVSVLVLLVGASALVRRVWPRLAFSPGELLTVYVMLVAAASVSGHDQLQILFSTLPFIFNGATPQNKWEELIHPWLPRHWLPTQSGGAVTDLKLGGSTLYTAGHLQAWASPLAWWTAFLVAYILTMLCLAAIFRRQWDRERLSYPIAEIPLWITDSRRGLFRNRVFWTAFGLAAGLRVLTLMPAFLPGFPSVHVGTFDYYARAMPWSAAGAVPLSTQPYLYGLAYFMPLQLAFSVWFFCLFSRLEMVLGAALGFRQAEFPFLPQQVLGAWLAFCGLFLWTARGHLREVWRQARGHRGVDDSGEPLRYPVAFWGLVAGMLAMTALGVNAGMRPLTAALFFTLVMAMILVNARVRAELGLPTIELCCFAGVDNALQRVGGANAWTPRDRTAMALFWWLNRSYRQFPLPNYMDALRLGERTGLALPRLTSALGVATLLGGLAAFWAYLHLTYQIGFESAKFAASPWSGLVPWGKLAATLSAPGPPDLTASAAYLFGAGFTLLLSMLHLRVPGWPFHPAGYLVVGSWGALRYWLPIFVTWLTKGALLRYGGHRAYQQAMPFFLGLILGEFMAGFGRTLVDLAWGLYLTGLSGLN